MELMNPSLNPRAGSPILTSFRPKLQEIRLRRSRSNKWTGTPRGVVDGNEPESGGTIKRDGKMLVTGKLTNPNLEAKLMIWQPLPPMMSGMR